MYGKTKNKEQSSDQLRIDQDLHEKLERFCEDSGMPKTTAIERSLTAFIDSYYAERERFKTDTVKQ